MEDKKEYHRQASKKSYQINKEKRLAYAEKYRDENRQLLNAKRTAHYEANKEKIRARNRELYQVHKDALLEKNKIYREKNKEKLREQHVKRIYGIDRDQWLELQAKHRGRCAICSKKPKKLFIDHHHGTGKVRGMLCQNCNTALGHFFENLDLLKKAADYLLSYE